MALTLALGAASSATAQDLCANPRAVCGALLNAACLQTLGAGAISAEAAGADCPTQLTRYSSCLARAAETCGRSEDAFRAIGDRVGVAEIDGVPLITGVLWRGLHDENAASVLATLEPLDGQLAYIDISFLLQLAPWRVADLPISLEAVIECFDSGETPPPHDVVDAEEIVLLPTAHAAGDCAGLATPRSFVELEFNGDAADFISEQENCGTECYIWRRAGLFLVSVPFDNRGEGSETLGPIERRIELQAAGGEVVFRNKAARRARDIKAALGLFR